MEKSAFQRKSDELLKKWLRKQKMGKLENIFDFSGEEQEPPKHKNTGGRFDFTQDEE